MCQIKLIGSKNKKRPVLSFCHRAKPVPVEYAKLVLGLGTYMHSHGRSNAQQESSDRFDGNNLNQFVQAPTEYNSNAELSNFFMDSERLRTYRTQLDIDIHTSHSSYSSTTSMNTPGSHHYRLSPNNSSRQEVVRLSNQTVVDRLTLHSATSIEKPSSASATTDNEQSTLFREIETILNNIPKEVFALNNVDTNKCASQESKEDLLAKIEAAQSGLKYLESQMIAIEQSMDVQILGTTTAAQKQASKQVPIELPSHTSGLKYNLQDTSQQQHKMADNVSSSASPQNHENVPLKKSTLPSQIPRFAQPTAATTRRADETLRQHKSPERGKSSYDVKTETGSNCATTPSPRRTGLPSAWLTKDSGNNEPRLNDKTESAKTTSSATNAQTSPRKETNYMSSTQATLRRKASSRKPLSAQIAPPSPSSLQHAALGKAIAEINATNMAMIKESYNYARSITNTTIVPREENEEMLSPIVRKLDKQGLLKDETNGGNKQDNTTTASNVGAESISHSRSYADALRRPYSNEPLGMRAQKSSEIGKAIAHRACRSSEAYSEAQAKTDSVIEDDLKSCTSKRDQPTHGLCEIAGQNHGGSEDSSTIADDGSSAPRDADTMTAKQRTISNQSYQRTPSFTFNATAASFEPGSSHANTWTSHIEQECPNSSGSDDVFHTKTDRWYRSLSLEQLSFDIPQRMLNPDLADPLNWHKTMLLSQLGQDSGQGYNLAQVDSMQATPSGYDDTAVQSPMDHNDTPVNPRYGWTVSSQDNYGTTWYGGNGREIRCARYGPDVERARFQTYAYQNRRTGTLAVMQDSPRTSPPDWLSKWLALQDLQSAMAKGHLKVPCKHFGADLPDECSQYISKHRGAPHRRDQWK